MKLLLKRFSGSPLPVGRTAPDMETGDDNSVLAEEVEQRVGEFTEERSARLPVNRLKGGRVTLYARQAGIRRAEEFETRPLPRASHRSNAS